MTTVQENENDARRRTCQECGMLCDQEGEFHPHVFCVLKKAGRDPWDDLIWNPRAVGDRYDPLA